MINKSLQGIFVLNMLYIDSVKANYRTYSTKPARELKNYSSSFMNEKGSRKQIIIDKLMRRELPKQYLQRI